MEIAQLEAIARECRVQIIRMITHAGSGHPGGSNSVIDLLVALYFGKKIRVDPKRPDWPDRDRVILSKGHAVPALGHRIQMTERARYSSPSTQTPNGRSEKSTRVTSSVTKSVPNRSAWRRNSAIISGPMIPSG